MGIRFYRAALILGLIFLFSAVIGMAALHIDLPAQSVIPQPTPFPSHNGSGYGNG